MILHADIRAREGAVSFPCFSQSVACLPLCQSPSRILYQREYFTSVCFPRDDNYLIRNMALAQPHREFGKILGSTLLLGKSLIPKIRKGESRLKVSENQNELVEKCMDCSRVRWAKFLRSLQGIVREKLGDIGIFLYKLSVESDEELGESRNAYLREGAKCGGLVSEHSN